MKKKRRGDRNRGKIIVGERSRGRKNQRGRKGKKVVVGAGETFVR